MLRQALRTLPWAFVKPCCYVSFCNWWHLCFTRGARSLQYIIWGIYVNSVLSIALWLHVQDQTPLFFSSRDYPRTLSEETFELDLVAKERFNSLSVSLYMSAVDVPLPLSIKIPLPFCISPTLKDVPNRTILCSLSALITLLICTCMLQADMSGGTPLSKKGYLQKGPFPQDGGVSVSMKVCNVLALDVVDIIQTLIMGHSWLALVTYYVLLDLQLKQNEVPVSMHNESTEVCMSLICRQHAIAVCCIYSCWDHQHLHIVLLLRTIISGLCWIVVLLLRTILAQNYRKVVCVESYCFVAQNYRKRWFVLSGGPREGGYTLTFYKVHMCMHAHHITSKRRLGRDTYMYICMSWFEQANQIAQNQVNK